MRLNSLDELFEFMSYKGLKISDLDFSIAEEALADTPENSPQESCQVQESETRNTNTSSIEGYARIKTFNDNPKIPFEEGDENIIYVKSFESIPDSCHMGKINLLERELFGGICTEGDHSKIDLLVEFFGEDGSPCTMQRSFVLKKTDDNQKEKMILNISK